MSGFTALLRRHGDHSHSSPTPTPSPESSTLSVDNTVSTHTSHMSMTFHASLHTPLYHSSWTPQTAAQFAATLVFLFILGILYRGLLAGRTLMEARWQARSMPRLTGDGESDSGFLAEKEAAVNKWHGLNVTKFNPRVDLLRAVGTSLVVVVGYMLMLAVMTMNVGYCAAVVGGVFVGEVAVGRFIGGGAEH